MMAYTSAFPQSGSSSAGIWVISASDIHVGQTTSTREIPLLFSRNAVGSKVPCIGLAEFRRQGQWVAQTGDEWLFWLTVLGSEEADVLTINQLSTQQEVWSVKFAGWGLCQDKCQAKFFESVFATLLIWCPFLLRPVDLSTWTKGAGSVASPLWEVLSADLGVWTIGKSYSTFTVLFQLVAYKSYKVL